MTVGAPRWRFLRLGGGSRAPVAWISRVICHGYVRISRVNSPKLKSVQVAKAAEILSRYEKPQKEEPKEEKASNSATLSPKRKVVCVSLSPVKAQKKRREQTPSPSSARITIDLTAEEEYASFPLTQLSEREPSTYELNEKESIVYEREMYCSRVWTAPATPAIYMCLTIPWL